MSKWEMVRLGDVCIIERGGSPRPIQSYITNAENGINWIKIGDTEPNSMYINKTKEKIKPEGMKKSRYVQKGDFVLSNSMSFGRPYIMNIDGCIHDGWLLIRDEKNVFDKKFLYYSLSSPSTFLKFKSSAVGGVVNNLNSDIVRKTTIPLPPLEFQKHIAETLDKASDIINLHKKRLVELDNLIKATFYDMFGDFSINDRGWDVKILQDVTNKITDGKHGDCQNEEDSGYYFISAKDIYDGKIIYDNARQITKIDFEEVHKRTKLSLGDVVVVNTGATIGKSALILDEDKCNNTTFQKSVGIIETNKEQLSSVFLQKYIVIDKDNIYKSASGSAQKNWLLSQMRNYKIMVPPIELQNKFAQIVTKIEEQKTLEKQAISESENLFNSLMSKYFD